MSSSKIILEKLDKIENSFKEVITSNFLVLPFDFFEQFDLMDKHLDFLVDCARDEQKNQILKMLLRRSLNTVYRRKSIDEYTRTLLKVNTTDISEWFTHLLRSVQQNEKKESIQNAE